MLHTRFALPCFALPSVSLFVCLTACFRSRSAVAYCLFLIASRFSHFSCQDSKSVFASSVFASLSQLVPFACCLARVQQVLTEYVRVLRLISHQSYFRGKPVLHRVLRADGTDYVILGCFDGHGVLGHMAAQHASEQVSTRLAYNMSCSERLSARRRALKSGVGGVAYGDRGGEYSRGGERGRGEVEGEGRGGRKASEQACVKEVEELVKRAIEDANAGLVRWMECESQLFNAMCQGTNAVVSELGIGVLELAFG